MMEVYHLLCSLLLYLFVMSSGQLSQDKEKLLNWCLKGQNHKTKPGKEIALHEQCGPWKEHSCCTESVSHDIHDLNLYNFTLDHCYDEVKKNISAGCKKHFKQDNCFYECEPHVGFWVVNTTRKMSSERFYKVPLCSADCDEWFDACKDDFTCAYNWPQDFKFKNGRNFCPDGSKCMTFKEMFLTSKEFCENVWDHSWKYTTGKHCMHIWFDGVASDVNKKTAEFYIDKMLASSRASFLLSSSSILLILAISWKMLF